MTRCLYEVLGVSPTATSEQVRAAYKELALAWHPDKNQHRVEEATEKFRELQSAYAVLNDSEERAKYDAQREALQEKENSVRGPSRPSSREFREKQQEEINLWPYFKPDIFSGSGDSERGFFNVYSDVFDQLHKQEQEALRNKGRPVLPEPPPLGNLTSSWESVKAFYKHWTNFRTAKDYAWFDEYFPETAPDDKTKKWMERENDKNRKRHKKEFEEQVKKLAAHTQKKDPRVLARKKGEVRTSPNPSHNPPPHQRDRKKAEEDDLKKKTDEERRQKEEKEEREREEERRREREEERKREREEERKRERDEERRREREEDKKRDKERDRARVNEEPIDEAEGSSDTRGQGQAYPYLAPIIRGLETDLRTAKKEIKLLRERLDECLCRMDTLEKEVERSRPVKEGKNGRTKSMFSRLLETKDNN